VATRTYNFTHSSDSDYTTRLVLTDGAVGKLNWNLSFRRASLDNKKFNTNTTTFRPNFEFNGFGFNTSGVYNFDFRDANYIVSGLRMVVGSNQARYTTNFGAAVGDIINDAPIPPTTSQGFPAGTRITAITNPSTANRSLTLSQNAQLTATRDRNFTRNNNNLFVTISFGTFDVTPGTTYSFSGFSQAFSTIQRANISGSFTTAAGLPPAPVWQTGTTLAGAVRGSTYSATVVASPATSYQLVSFGGNSAGLNFTNGVIGGTPTSTGTATVTVRAVNTSAGGSRTTDRTFSISIVPPPPSFSDQSITTTWIKTRNFSAAPNRTVSASDTTSYSIVTSGTGLSPTAWLTINSSGQLSGIPAAVGVYTFRVRASGGGGATNSSQITLTINPPGNRSAGTGVPIDLTNAKRFNGTNWNTNISIFKRFDGSSWVDITN